MNELTIGDKVYVSSKKAAEITGYAKDYVGQLCREGHVEAKMVGRSWYVLESSIREHRFGKQEEKASAPEPVKAPSAPEISLPATWEPPTYISEPVSIIPTIVSAPKSVEMPQQVEMEDKLEEEPALSEMQSAWREWFETRKDHNPVPPQAIESRKEEPKTMDIVPIRKFEELDVEEIQIRREPEPIVTMSPPIRRQPEQAIRPRKRDRRPSTGSNMVIVAFLIVVAGISVVTALVGTGYAGQYLNDNPVVRFLGGTSSISK